MDITKSSSSSNLKASPPAGVHTDRAKDSRRRRGQLSCAECRRLKLRCDRVFPCESCTKRGCASICPDGSLATKGTRFVLANTEEYHTKISEMSDRIRELEEALAQLHPSVSHPLLREDLLLIKVPVELSNKVDTSLQHTISDLESSYPHSSEPHHEDPSVPLLLNISGTLSTGRSGTRFFGKPAYAEHFLQDTKDDDVYEEPLDNAYTLPPKLQLITHAFPHGTQYRDPSTVQKLLDFLPPLSELYDLVDVYYTNGAWIYEPCPRQLFMRSLNHVLERMEDPLELSLNDLALVFAVLAHGVLVDLRQKPYSPLAMFYHQLSRASLSLSPVIQEPAVSNIQTLFLLGWFWNLYNQKDGINEGWLIQCLNAKLAQTMGLHRDIEDSDFTDETYREARRTAFWELFTLEGWQSLGLGRPMTAHISDIHCAMPATTARAMAGPDSRLHVWHTWKHGFAKYVCRVLEITLSAGTPPYRDILELDRSIQAYKLPVDANMQANGLVPPVPKPGQSPGLDMQRSLSIQAHSTALLLLHRGFFGRALDEETDPMQSRFAPSVLATYTSAWRNILALQTIHNKYPALTHRFGLFWSNAFSASIALCLLVTRATRSSYATGALEGMNVLYGLFSAAAVECFPASIALPVITRLRDKAQAAYAPYIQGHPTAMVRRGGDHETDDEDEELRALGGKTAISRLMAPLSSSLLRKYGSKSTERPGQDVDLTKSPMPIPHSGHLESVHPLLLQYVEQSRWASDASDDGITSENTSTMSSSSSIYPAPAYHTSNQGTDNNEGFVPLNPPTQQQAPPHRPHQAATQQNYQYNYSVQQTSAATSYGHAPANANTWPTHPSYIVPESSQQQNYYQEYGTQQQQSYYTDPSLDPYAEPSEYDNNQYAAWQSHLAQLGLLFNAT